MKQIVRFLLVCLLAIGSISGGRAQSSAQIFEGEGYAIDGDDIVLAGRDTRLGNIQAPEIQTFEGAQAFRALEALIAGQNLVCTQFLAGGQPETTSKNTGYRPVVRCALPDGRDVAEEMVRNGYAWVWPIYARRHGDFERLSAAEKAACRARAGLWAPVPVGAASSICVKQSP